MKYYKRDLNICNVFNWTFREGLKKYDICHLRSELPPLFFKHDKHFFTNFCQLFYMFHDFLELEKCPSFGVNIYPQHLFSGNNDSLFSILFIFSKMTFCHHWPPSLGWQLSYFFNPSSIKTFFAKQNLKEYSHLHGVRLNLECNRVKIT